jgi:hypothetical protein
MDHCRLADATFAFPAIRRSGLNLMEYIEEGSICCGLASSKSKAKPLVEVLEEVFNRPHEMGFRKLKLQCSHEGFDDIGARDIIDLIEKVGA